MNAKHVTFDELYETLLRIGGDELWNAFRMLPHRVAEDRGGDGTPMVSRHLRPGGKYPAPEVLSGLREAGLLGFGGDRVARAAYKVVEDLAS